MKRFKTNPNKGTGIAKRAVLSARDNSVSREDVDELVLTITNDGDFYRQRITPAIDNLKRKYKSGKYDRDLAVKLWQYVADAGVREYDKRYGSGGGSVAWLNPATRKAIAEELRDYYEEEVMYEEDVQASTDPRCCRPITAAESYGWVVEDYDAQEAYEFACEYFGKEELDGQIVKAIDNQELAACLAFIFRMNDFNDWENYKNESDNEDDYEEE